MLVLVKNSNTKYGEEMVTDFTSNIPMQKNNRNPADPRICFAGRTSGKRNIVLGHYQRKER